MVSVSELINKKKQQIQDKRAGNKNTYRFKQKTTTIRILPGWRKDGDPTFYHDFGQTWIKDMDGNVLAAVGDAKITYGQEDVVRGLVQRAMGEARTDAQRAHYKEMIAKPRILVNAQILDDKDIDPNVPEITEFSETQFEQILEQVTVAGIDEDFLSLENGFDLIVSKSGTGFQTKYSFTFARKTRKVPESIMENINDIDAYVRSKFAETERAVNALKSLTQSGDVLQIESRSTSLSGDDAIVDGDFNAVEDAKANPASEMVEVERRVLSDEELENLFADE